MDQSPTLRAPSRGSSWSPINFPPTRYAVSSRSTCLERGRVEAELAALKAMGFEDVLLLTGERCPQADFDYLLENVRLASSRTLACMSRNESMAPKSIYRRYTNGFNISSIC